MEYALITGASKGIGKYIAIELAKRKINVLLVARSGDELKKVTAEINTAYGVEAVFYVCDLSKPGAAKQIFNYCLQQSWSIKILVNNAGFGYAGSFEKYSAENYDEMMQVNMNALVNLCHVFIPSLRPQKQSYIMNIASSAAYQATPGLTVYAATKAFVLSFTRALRTELTGTNISVSCVCPGGTDTDFGIRAQVGTKAMKLSEKVIMTPQSVAAIAVKNMFKKRPEIITGAINKAGVFLAWLLPKKLVEKSAARIYEV